MPTCLGLPSGMGPRESNPESHGFADKFSVGTAAPWAGCVSSLTSIAKSRDNAALLQGAACPGCEEGAPWPGAPASHCRPPLPTVWLCRYSPGRRGEEQLSSPGPSDQQLHTGWTLSHEPSTPHTWGGTPRYTHKGTHTSDSPPRTMLWSAHAPTNTHTSYAQSRGHTQQPHIQTHMRVTHPCRVYVETHFPHTRSHTASSCKMHTHSSLCTPCVFTSTHP